jgi:hypothetical protein
MGKSLTFEYDEAGDILHIDTTPPYPEQETEPLAYNLLARRNPDTGAIENLEVLFFTRWLLKGGERQAHDLADLFEAPATAANA